MKKILEGSLSRTRFILIVADAVDPDNLVLVAAAGILNPGARIRLLLSGRPVNPGVTQTTHPTPCREWFNNADPTLSRKLQIRNAARFVKFAERFGVELKVFDGGIAPRTLVPHWIHADETVVWGDTPPDAETKPLLRSREELAAEILGATNPDVYIITGGPETANLLFFQENPEVMRLVLAEYAMLANWGSGALMNVGGERSPYQQFNAACDPVAAMWILTGAPWPITMTPTETTKQPGICFNSVEALRRALPDTSRAGAIVNLYRVWWDVAELEKRGGIVIYDLCPLFASDPQIGDKIFETVPVEVLASTCFPYELTEPGQSAHAHWGEIHFRQYGQGQSNRFATLPKLRPGGAQVYMDTLRRICS